MAHVSNYLAKTANNRMALWLFILSDSFVFGGLLVTRFVLLGDERPELSQGLGLAVTALLLLSSFFMNRGEVEIAHGNHKGFVRNLTITLVLGILFLVGVVFVEWPLAAAHGLTTDSSTAGAVFYVMTGYHAFHVVTGLIFLWIVLRLGRKGHFTQEKHWPVEAAAVYWHFIDIAWIFFYPALYLMGIVAG